MLFIDRNSEACMVRSSESYPTIPVSRTTLHGFFAYGGARLDQQPGIQIICSLFLLRFLRDRHRVVLYSLT